MKPFRTILILSLVFSGAGILAPKAQAARGRDYVMATSGIVSVTLLGALIYQALSEDKKTIPAAPDSPQQEKAQKAVEQLGQSSEETHP